MAHKWSKNPKTTVPRQNIFFDTETWNYTPDSGQHIIMTLRLGYAIFRTFYGKTKADRRHVFYFETGEDFFNFVQTHINENERLCIYAHNIEFDLRVTQFYYYAFKHGWRSRIPYTKGGVFIDSISKDNMKIDLIDTFNHFKTPLKKLGESLNLPKFDVNFNTNKYIPKRILKPYCLRDVEIIEKAIEQYYSFLTEHDLGHAQRTVASQAFATYRHRFMKGEIWVQAKKQPHELERQSYYGGRVECFQMGKITDTPVYKLDINSQYPFVMKTNLFPYGFAFVKPSCSISALIKYLSKYLITAQCYISTDEPAYPKKINNKLCFPVGNFWTTLSTPELIYALNHNHLKEVKQIEGHKAGPIFKEYVEFMYNERLKYKKQGNKPYALFLKYLMNSLYGKTGQKERVTIEADISDFFKLKEAKKINVDGSISTIKIFGGRQVETTTQHQESFNSYCAIAAHVTAYARMYLYEIMKKAGEGNYFYCDTDSLFTNKQGYENLKDYLSETELGKLKLEAETNNLIIRGNKDYTFGDKQTLKGVKSSAKLIGPNVYQYYEWTRFNSVFKYGLLAPPMQILKTKILKRKYEKGKIENTGKVTPYILDEPID